MTWRFRTKLLYL